MKRALWPFLIAFLIAFILGAALQSCATLVNPTVANAEADAPSAAEVVTLINDYRASRGLPALREDSRLAAAAYGHSTFMQQSGCFAHVCPGEPSPSERAQAAGYPSGWVGEVIGKGYRTAWDVVMGWRNSPGHDAILRGTYRDIGCGLVLEGGPYWTCVFGNAQGGGGATLAPTLPPPGATLTPMPWPQPSAVPLATATPTPTPQPTDRGPLPAGWVMYIFIPLPLLNLPTPLEDCHLPGATCAATITIDYDRSTWLATDYAYGEYCVKMAPRGVVCRWGRK